MNYYYTEKNIEIMILSIQEEIKKIIDKKNNLIGNKNIFLELTTLKIRIPIYQKNDNFEKYINYLKNKFKHIKINLCKNFLEIEVHISEFNHKNGSIVSISKNTT